jgi:hypothetical protein
MKAILNLGIPRPWPIAMKGNMSMVPMNVIIHPDA